MDPAAFAKNMIIKDIRIDTASILTVAPRGMAMLVIWLDTPISSSIHCLLNGMVAELEQVPKAFSAAGRIAFRNFSGLCLPISFTERPYTTIAKPKNATYRMTSCVAREMIVSVPLASTTGTMVQKTPMGVKYMMVVMIFRHTSLMESIRFRNGVPFSPTAISVKPMIRQTPEPGACFRQQMRRLGWKGSGFSGCQGYCSFL